MNFDLSDEQELFRASAMRFAAPVDVEARRRLRSLAGGYDRARWRELAELGLLALTVDEAHGGMGGSLADLAVVAEALGSANAPDPWLENGVFPARLLALAGADNSLAQVLDGTCFCAVGFAERGQRYAFNPRATRCEEGRDGIVLNGEKTFVPGGPLADALLVSAADGGQTRWFLVTADAEGVHQRAYGLADGSQAGELRLLGVWRVGSELVLANDAFEQLAAELRVLAGAEMVGLGQRLLDDTLAYVKERRQFGVAIGSFQALQHRLVECYAALEQARSMLWRVVLGDRADPAQWSRKASGAKAYIGDNIRRIGREAVQMHGGMGITDELAVGHAFKRLMVLDRFLGDEAAGLAHYAEAA